MATIRKRLGKWNVQIRHQGSKPISKTFLRKSDAEEWARHLEVKADRNDLAPSRQEMAQHNLSHILTRYRNEITVKKKGRKQEDRILAYFLKLPLAELSLDLLNESHIADFRDMRLAQVKPATYVREIAVLQHALEVARLEWRYPLRNNPVLAVRKPKVNNARDRRLEDGEFQKLMIATEKCLNQHISPLIRFALETGLRQSELLRIEPQDVDLMKRVLRIPHTKNGHSRTIPLSKLACEILSARLETEVEQLFPITLSSLRQAWKRLLKRSGIIGLHFHDLRHEAITRFFEKGLTIPEVALISGHKDPRMLFRYTHLKAQDLVSKLD